MDDKASLRKELAFVDRQIADASQRAANLENIVGLMRAMRGDIGAADRALMATYHALGLLTRRRATLLKVVHDGVGGDHS